MLTGQNSSISADISALKSKAGAKIASAIQNASAKTGVDFTYLMQQAQVESSFKANAKAKTSSATGLYQFIDSTWLAMVNKYGAKHNIDQNASRTEILNLRNDPKVCSLMAGELAAENKNYLQNCVGGDIGSTELYMAHFMGPGGAAKFLKALHANPTASAADTFPQAAAANKNVFYTKSGKEKSLAEVYAFFDNKFQIESDIPATAYDAVDTQQPVSNVIIPTETAEETMKYDHKFNETNGRWTRIRAANTTPLAASWTPTDNLGGIAGLSPSFVTPIDILDLLKTDYSRQGRYNS
ncbi:MAG TPA: transglycosylase SLT domain-containing protein [Alphaproteobacteria bacterium]|nr:transglycosylase SLT domain-containing protein [Alphaproteobacteria bacterium]HNS44542.1 transglycosylase SLT domain-containing protein [Alphaproteobacteria bacterium]